MTEPTTAARAIDFERCPVCGNSSLMRLPDDWQAQVQAGRSIPIIACGNPWHYDGMEAASEALGLLRALVEAGEPIVEDGEGLAGHWCLYCDASDYPKVKHDADCEWEKARAYLAAHAAGSPSGEPQP